MKTIRINYEDNGLDIIDKINDVLKEYKLEILHDNEEHDGYDIYSLKEILK